MGAPRGDACANASGAFARIKRSRLEKKGRRKETKTRKRSEKDERKKYIYQIKEANEFASAAERSTSVNAGLSRGRIEGKPATITKHNRRQTEADRECNFNEFVSVASRAFFANNFCVSFRQFPTEQIQAISILCRSRVVTEFVNQQKCKFSG